MKKSCYLKKGKKLTAYQSRCKTLLKPSELSGLHATKFYDLVVLYKTVKKFRIFIIDLCKKDDHIKTNVLNKNLIIKTSMQLH